jgi:hypothetical protein
MKARNLGTQYKCRSLIEIGVQTLVNDWYFYRGIENLTLPPSPRLSPS